MDLLTIWLVFIGALTVWHLWGRSRFIGAWLGVVLLLFTLWLFQNPAIIPVGTTTTYTYDQATGRVTTETLTYNYDVLPDVLGMPGSTLLAWMLLPVSLYLLFYNLIMRGV